MSHEIETFAFSGEPAWHKLGKKVTNDMTVPEMLKAAELDWDVEMHPAYVDIDGKKYNTGRQALVRSSDHRVLDMVTDNWKPLQNRDGFEFFREFVENGSMTMECAGSLKKGQIVFGLAKVDETIEVIKGDPMHQYLLFTIPHKYASSIDVRLTAVRVVCWNTMQMALNTTSLQLHDTTAKSSVRINHRSTFDAEKTKATLGLASDKFKKYGEALKFLTEKRADPTQIEFYLKEVFPHYNDDKKDELSRTARIVLANLETQAGVEYGQGTWYSVLNGVTFVTDNVLGRSDATRVYSSWYGGNATHKQVALKKAIEYATAA